MSCFKALLSVCPFPCVTTSNCNPQKPELTFQRKKSSFSVRSMPFAVLLSFMWLSFGLSSVSGTAILAQGSSPPGQPVWELPWSFLLVCPDLDAPLCSPSSTLLYEFFSSLYPCMEQSNAFVCKLSALASVESSHFNVTEPNSKCKNCLLKCIRDISHLCSCQNTSASGSLSKSDPICSFF